MKIVIEGCAHGELDQIYEAVDFLEKQKNFKVDMLICCGDFQAVRNPQDLKCMAVPPKYQTMNTFYKYYSGEKTAPMLTLFIGGNHEASNFLGELAYGGWVAPNIYYMGYAGVVNVSGVRIAGISGIYKGEDYLKGHHEFPPYDNSTMRSAYHVRNLEVFRLKQLGQHVDIALSHDWPREVYNYGDSGDLLRRKRFFTEEVQQNKLGSRPNKELLDKIKPSYWFAAHLHVKFAAVIPHATEDDKDEKKVTKFLALDKCLPRRHFLQMLDIGLEPTSDSPLELHYDAEWLAILRSTNHLLNVSKQVRYTPGPGCQERYEFQPSEEEITEVLRRFDNDLKIPLNFSQTAEPYRDPSTSPSPTSSTSPFSTPPPSSPRFGHLSITINPQTTELCRKLGIDDPLQLLSASATTPGRTPDRDSSFRQFASESELNVTSSSHDIHNVDGDDLFFHDVSASASTTIASSFNDDEIPLDDDEEEEEVPSSPVRSQDDSFVTSSPTTPVSGGSFRRHLGSGDVSAVSARVSIGGTLPRGQDDASEVDEENIFASPSSVTSCLTSADSVSSDPTPTPPGGICAGVVDASPVLPTGVVKKTFRRRNQALYEPPKDDSDD